MYEKLDKLLLKVGSAFTNNIAVTVGYIELFLSTIVKFPVILSNHPVRTVFYKQVYFTGIEAVNKITLLALILGIVAITQIHAVIGANAELTNKILVWIMVKELGSLLTALIVITRSGTAIASELASMQVNAEIKSLMRMGIDPKQYLILPRIVGITVSIFCLAFVFQFASIFGGVLVTSYVLDFPLGSHLDGIVSALDVSDIVASALKSLAFGIIISTVASYHGFNVKTSITEIPQAATRAVMHSLILIFVVDGIITALISL